MMLSLRYDLRAPAFGPSTSSLYAAAIEQSVWAEQHGFMMVALSEHHGSDDGYCPSPMMVASAIASRTSTLRLLLAALVLPLHEPVRLAEDLAVLSILSGGRVDMIAGAGYLPQVRDVRHHMDERRAWEPSACCARHGRASRSSTGATHCRSLLCHRGRR
jgi:alkanesulfonate monooxygenase SsuD/methylene tetrahydromethanopterin reductase-like flavin-dependent oxidoreductase (luciferase family)